MKNLLPRAATVILVTLLAATALHTSRLNEATASRTTNLEKSTLLADSVLRPSPLELSVAHADRLELALGGGDAPSRVDLGRPTASHLVLASGLGLPVSMGLPPNGLAPILGLGLGEIVERDGIALRKLEAKLG